MTETSTAGHFADKQSRDLLFGMDLREVADLATALAMAISGMHKMAVNPGRSKTHSNSWQMRCALAPISCSIPGERRTSCRAATRRS